VSRARCVVLNLVNTSFGCAREILRSLYDTLTKPIYERFAGQDKHLVSEVQWIVGLGLIPYAIAVLMPSWRWLLAVTLIIGGALAAIWIQDWVVRSDPGYRGGGFGEALGLAFGYVITTAFATGVGIRAITLILASRGLRLRHVFTICVAGIALVPAIIIVPSAWHEWQMQPPSEACSNATFHVKVANAEFVIPSPPVFIVYLANTSSRNAYYFFSNPSLRAFCGLSDNGKQSVTATNISLRFDRFQPFAPVQFRTGLKPIAPPTRSLATSTVSISLFRYTSSHLKISRLANSAHRARPTMIRCMQGHDPTDRCSSRRKH
jgi:hypothetical protein